jgi:putative transcriptional regulator
MSNWYALTDREILSEWGKRIRLARMEKDFTQQQLAERSGLNRTTIRDVEAGKSGNLLSIIALFRAMDLLQQLENVLPGVAESPVLERLKLERQRVRSSRKS